MSIRRLRGRPAPGIRFVFLTARDSTEDKIRGLTLGGDGLRYEAVQPRRGDPPGSAPVLRPEPGATGSEPPPAA